MDDVARLDWLNHGMSFLTGLHEAARRRRVFVTIQVFVDESGVDSSGPVLVLAGVIGKAEDWLALSDQWKAVLDTPPRMRAFKMRRPHKSEKMAAKLRQLAPVMNAHPFTVIHCSMDLAAFKELIAADEPKPIGDPYFFPFLAMVALVGFHLSTQGQKERFEIIFDEQVVFGPRAKRWYPEFKSLMPPDVQAIMPVEPLFRSDDEFMPLQVADLFAGLLRLEMIGKGENLQWFHEAIPNVEWSPHSQFIDRGRIQERADGMTPEFIAKAREFWKEHRSEMSG